MARPDFNIMQQSHGLFVIAKLFFVISLTTAADSDILQAWNNLHVKKYLKLNNTYYVRVGYFCSQFLVNEHYKLCYCWLQSTG